MQTQPVPQPENLPQPATKPIKVGWVSCSCQLSALLPLLRSVLEPKQEPVETTTP